MKRLQLRNILLLLALMLATQLPAQTTKWRDIHKVKKKETIFGIAREYGITVEDLMTANPEMKQPDYQLKKGDYVFIPFAKEPQPQVPEPKRTPVQQTPVDDVRQRAIRLGVMLPLHDENGDGRRMIEYYRGVLMACDSMRSEGISVDVHAWNLAENGSVEVVTADPAAARCDLIIGPLYSKQMPALSKFTEKHDIMLLIPFSINTPELYSNRHIFQVYQTQNDQNEQTVRHFMRLFGGQHVVIVDCNDSTSTKGPFTASLRRALETQGTEYNLTSLKTSEEQFQKAFSATKNNVVVLNTGRSKELGVTFAKLNGLKNTNPNMQITVFGYTDWLLYTNAHLENLYKFSTYIPTPFYTNQFSPLTNRLQRLYRQHFHVDMQPVIPRFALTGFDHAVFFLRGLHKYGKTFNGAAGMFGYQPVQTPLQFERIANGGSQNRFVMFVHYTPDHRIETVKF